MRCLFSTNLEQFYVPWFTLIQQPNVVMYTLWEGCWKFYGQNSQPKQAKLQHSLDGILGPWETTSGAVYFKRWSEKNRIKINQTHFQAFALISILDLQEIGSHTFWLVGMCGLIPVCEQGFPKMAQNFGKKFPNIAPKIEHSP